jgi:molybdate transport system substrate-binding protein
MDVPRRINAILLLSLTSAPLDAQTTSPPRQITVYAAASLTDAFRELAPLMERGSAPARVRYNFAGSQQLAVQLELGARADVFASADQHWMAYVQQRRLTAGAPRIFAHNRLVAILPRSNRARIHQLQDLARQGVKLVVGAEAVPIGRYTREMIRRLDGRAGFPPGYGDRVLANVVSQEENVKSVVAKVQLGEADAGIVYRSDVTPRLARSLAVLEIPEDANVVASYPVAVLKGSREPAAAEAFLALLLGPEGRRALARHGLTPAEATP